MTSYCACGTKLYREYRWNGHASVPEYYAADTFYGRGGARITHCEGCGEQLRPEILSNHPQTVFDSESEELT